MNNSKTKSELKVLNKCLSREINQTEYQIKNIEQRLQFIQNIIGQNNSDTKIVESFRVEIESAQLDLIGLKVTRDRLILESIQLNDSMDR